MKKIIFSIITVMMIMIPIHVQAESKNEVTIYMFRGNTCPHCEEALEYLKNHEEEVPKDIKFITYEVYNNSKNNTLLQNIEKKLNFAEDDIGSIPLFIVGNEYKLGYSSASDLKQIFNLAETAKNSDNYEDIVAKEIKDSKLKVSGVSLEKLIGGPNKVVTAIVFGVFGLIVLGFGAMILFSRKN